MLAILAITIAILLLVHLLFNYNYRARLFYKIPGPEGAFIFGNAPDCVFLSPVELFDFFREIHKKWRSINRLWSFPYGLVNLYKPEDIEIVIGSTKNNKKNLFYTFLESWLQEGLLLSSGKKWQYRRKILTPAFHFKILKQFCAVFEDNSQRLVAALKESENKSIDVIPMFSEFTLHTICETAMGIKLNSTETASGGSYMEAVACIGDAFYRRCSKVHLYSKFMYYWSAIRKLEKKYVNIVHHFTKTVINTKRNSMHNKQMSQSYDDDEDTNSKKSKIAFLDLLLTAEKNGQIDHKGIQEEVDTFMFEGHDTTGSGLAYFFMLLANNKRIQNNIVDELNGIFGESKRTATIEDLQEMRYLDRCAKESLRLYPPIPTFGRILSEETTLSGYRVPAGTHCLIQVYDLHHREDLYKDPFVFDPDRFLPENSENRHPFAYLPFSAGPRNCIGQKFAMLEIKSVVSSVLREFELEPITKPADVNFTSNLVLRSTVPIYVRFTRRNVDNA